MLFLICPIRIDLASSSHGLPYPHHASEERCGGSCPIPHTITISTQYIMVPDRRRQRVYHAAKPEKHKGIFILSRFSTPTIGQYPTELQNEADSGRGWSLCGISSAAHAAETPIKRSGTEFCTLHGLRGLALALDHKLFLQA